MTPLHNVIPAKAGTHVRVNASGELSWVSAVVPEARFAATPG